MWSIQKFWTDPVLPRSSCTAFRVNGRTNRSILKEVVAGFWDGGTTTQKKIYYQIFADGVYKYGFCSTRSQVNDSPIRSLGESTLAVESDLPKDRLRAGWKTSLGASETVWLHVCLSRTLAPSAAHRRCRLIGSVFATTSSAEHSARS